jgi:opacity protein-like surface antigen
MNDIAIPVGLALQAALALLAMLACGLAAAQTAAWATHPSLQDRWNFQLGVFIPSVDTKARLNSSTRAIGTEISFEDDLGFSDRETTGAFLGSVRLGERWKIEAEYLPLRRSSSRAVSRTINWGDNVYTVGTVVSGDFDSDVIRISGGYSFIKDAQKELGISLGLHATDFKISLAATGVGGQTADTLAPLPTIGVYGAYAFTPRWLVSGRLDYLSLNYGDYDGSLVNFNVGVDYRFSRNFGVGIGYRYVDYDLTVSKSKFNGSVNYQFNGPLLYVVGSF